MRNDGACRQMILMCTVGMSVDCTVVITPNIVSVFSALCHNDTFKSVCVIGRR